MTHKSGADVDLDALGGGDAAASGKRGGKGARLFLLSMAGGLIASAAIASLAPESFIHSPPEFGMAEAFARGLEEGLLRLAQDRAPCVLELLEQFLARFDQ